MRAEKLILPSFAKINWLLRVLGKREDNYHEIFTVFQTVSLRDELMFEESDELSLTCDNQSPSVGSDNLIIKSANVLRQIFGVTSGAKIHLKKNIPFPGGLGGGSSNAAIAILGLAKLWHLKVNGDDLAQIGSRIGADVPFFFHGGTALGKGRGAEISKFENINRKFMVITTPNVDISTAKAFENLGSGRLTKSASKSILQNCYEETGRLNSGQMGLINDFENGIFEIYPRIKRLKQALLDLGALNCLMSGSGASIYGVFDNDERRQKALDKLRKDESLRTFAVETISRQKYLECFEPCKDLLPKSF